MDVRPAKSKNCPNYQPDCAECYRTYNKNPFSACILFEPLCIICMNICFINRPALVLISVQLCICILTLH